MRTSSPRPVVITGYASVSAAGVGKHLLAESLATGSTPATAMQAPESPRFQGPSQFPVATVPGGAVKELVSVREARRMCRLSSWVVAAARLAIQDSGQDPLKPLGDRCGVCHATCFSSTESSVQLLEALERDGPEAMSPYYFMESVVNAPGAHVSMRTGARGPNLALSHREGSPLDVLGRGASLVAAGRVDQVIVTCGDEMNPILLSVLYRHRACIPVGQVARPLDLRRRGFLPSEGACALVLEAESLAESRGAEVLGRVVGSKRMFDPSAERFSWGSPGNALADSAQAFIRKCGVAVGAVVAGASGAVQGDRAEAQFFHEAFGSSLPSVFAPKTYTGEFGGHLLPAALLLLEGYPMRCREDFEEDPKLGIRPSGGVLPRGVSTVLLSAFSSGGNISLVLLERP